MDISCPNWDLGIVDEKIVSDHPHIQFVAICDCLSQARAPKATKEAEKVSL
jgi:uncharacterized protein (DUF433 family)